MCLLLYIPNPPQFPESFSSLPPHSLWIPWWLLCHFWPHFEGSWRSPHRIHQRCVSGPHHGELRSICDAWDLHASHPPQHCPFWKKKKWRFLWNKQNMICHNKSNLHPCILNFKKYVLNVILYSYQVLYKTLKLLLGLIYWFLFPNDDNSFLVSILWGREDHSGTRLFTHLKRHRSFSTAFSKSFTKLWIKL